MNISANRLIKISKFLSYHLRHRPDKLGLELATGGWVEVEQLLAAAINKNFPLDIDELQTVVARNDKQRFSFDDTGKLIRANQGHSIPIDLQLQASTPPPILYHGTYEQALKSILQHGLKKMSRHHVHLSSDWQTAQKVGARRGKAVVLEIDAKMMVLKGFKFYLADNGVWLVDTIPKDYIKQSNNSYLDQR